MKIARIYYLINMIVLSLFTFALMGASGHKIINLNNSENLLFLCASIIFAANGLFLFITFIKNIDLRSNLLLALLSLSIVMEILLSIKIFGLDQSEDVNPTILLLWFSSILIVGIYLLIQSRFKYHSQE